MLLTSQQHLFLTSLPQFTNLLHHSTTSSTNLRRTLSSSSYTTQQPIWNFKVRHRIPIPAYGSDDGVVTTPSSSRVDGVTLDAFLATAEFLCIVSSAIITVSYAVNCTVPSCRNAAVLAVVGSNGAFAWGMAAMLGGVVLGGWIRRRHWRRICKEEGGESVSLSYRIGKVEEDLRSSVAIVRVLSRQLEKLGIRFRLTRKALKEPIAQTAALAQKNSEATRALALQESILEKELGEIQKLLLAMQEQQQKQLELILAIAKSGKLWETKQEHSSTRQDTVETSQPTEEAKHLETHEPLSSPASVGSNNEKS